MSFTSDLFAGLASLLDAAGIGDYLPTDTASDSGVLIVDKVLPASPDSAIALAQYPVSDDPSLSDSVIGVQVRTRIAGIDARPADDAADAIFDLLHGMTDVTLPGGVKVVNSERRSGTAAVKDDLLRWSRIDNYYLTVWRPSPNRT